MSEAHAIGGQPAAEHSPDEHSPDEHGHEEAGHQPTDLGPIDYAAWAAGLGGILLGLIVAFCLVLATA